MRLNEYSSRQYIVITKYVGTNKDVKDEHQNLAFFDSKEDWDELKEDSEEVTIFEGYADIPDVEICEHPDFESFIKEDARTR